MELMSKAQTLKSLVLRDTYLIDDTLYSFSGISLEMLDVSNTMVSQSNISGVALAHIVHGNPALKFLNVRGCKNLIQLESKSNGADPSSSYFHRDLCTLLGKKCKLEEIALGWGFSQFSLETLKPAFVSLRAITIGLGGSFSEDLLGLLPQACPLLESIVLYFQLISDSIVKNIIAYLRHLQALALCYCLGDISISSLCFSMPNLKKLRLERVTPWMTNDDLIILTQGTENLVELSLLGCRLLNPGQHCSDWVSPFIPDCSLHVECGDFLFSTLFCELNSNYCYNNAKQLLLPFITIPSSAP
uniref:BTB/POZ domain-containing protein FBL11 n=1 Tax=Rhizophora mucronata TaxID=61149 RepID=A0A2P2LXB5_RHIMU